MIGIWIIAFSIGQLQGRDLINQTPTFDLIERIAVTKARITWGDASKGDPIPYYDLKDRIIAYCFPFYPLANGHNSEGYILVSAQYCNQPLLEYGNCLPRCSITKDKAKQKAIKILGKNAKLAKVYYLGHLEEYFKFVSEKDTVFINTYSLKSRKSTDLRPQTTDKNRGLSTMDYGLKKWAGLEQGNLEFLLSTKKSGYVPGVPFYIWSYGCSPTASAMIMGYWDLQGYGKLVDYYYDHYDVVIEGIVSDVPNVQRELAIGMYTDTTTGGTYCFNMPGGHTYVANSLNGYNFGSEWYYWGMCWNEIVEEINAGRPTHWAVGNYWYGQYIAHSLCAVGYEVTVKGDSMVKVHNTWDHSEHWWALYTIHNGTHSTSDVITVIPGGEDTATIEITRPVGNDRLIGGIKRLVEWNSSENIEVVDVSFTTDEWETWSEVATAVENTGSCVWNVPRINTLNARLKMLGYAGGSELAGDGTQTKFQIATIEDTLNMSILGQYDTPGMTYKVHCIYPYAYLADGDKGLCIVDVSDPTLPIEMGSYETGNVIYSVFISDTIAYLANGTGGLHIVNIKDPQNIQFIGSFDTEGDSRDCKVKGSYAYIADYTNGLIIVDVTHPSEPSFVGHIDTDGQAVSVFIVDTLLYLSDRTKGLKIITVKNPVQPVIIGSYPSIVAMDTYVSGNVAYIASGTAGLRIVDISDPTNIEEISRYDTDGFATGLFFLGGKVYLADKGEGQRVIDVSDPAHPELSGYLNTLGDANGCFVSGNLVYTSDGGDGLYIIRFHPTGIEEQTENPKSEIRNPKLAVYPNPFTTVVSVQCSGISEGQKINMQIYDLSGRLVKTLTTNPSSLTTAVSWDGRDENGNGVMSGIYFIKIQNPNANDPQAGAPMVKKVVVIR